MEEIFNVRNNLYTVFCSFVYNNNVMDIICTPKEYAMTSTISVNVNWMQQFHYWKTYLSNNADNICEMHVICCIDKVSKKETIITFLVITIVPLLLNLSGYLPRCSLIFLFHAIAMLQKN